MPGKRPEKLSEDHLETLYFELERIAGVRHVSGRGWMGIRRWFADSIRDVAKVSDDRIENALMGHSEGRMIARYRNKQNTVVRQGMVNARETMWDFLTNTKIP